MAGTVFPVQAQKGGRVHEIQVQHPSGGLKVPLQLPGAVGQFQLQVFRIPKGAAFHHPLGGYQYRLAVLNALHLQDRAVLQRIGSTVAADPGGAEGSVGRRRGKGVPRVFPSANNERIGFHE
ncbi:hypothetical protein SDC9_206144 [bioreactor metagenome]|uniref:Uncharacterized protein n=1 Tax=bioreactor metagenome TaxID=1076179 RepID=A0A645J6X0_9ZZZZ